MNHWPKIQAVLWYVKYHAEHSEDARQNMRLRFRRLANADELNTVITVGNQMLAGDPNLPEWFPCERSEIWKPRIERRHPSRYSGETPSTPRPRQFDLHARCACRAGEWRCSGFTSTDSPYCHQHRKESDRLRAITKRTKCIQISKRVECPKVRMWLDLPDVEPVVPITEVSDAPTRGGCALASEINELAMGSELWMLHPKSSRRYEGFQGGCL